MFAVGSIVRLKKNPSLAGTTTGKTKASHGSTYWEVRMADGSGLRWLPETQLDAESSPPDPFADLAAGRFAEPALLRRLLLHHRLTGRLRDVIYSMGVTDTEFHAYQFKPVVKILSAPSQGLLIADEVGLGKTIEAGLVWTELVARFDSHRLLIVCPASLTEKWRVELWQKFSVDARIVDAADLLKILDRDELANDGFALIASLPSVRPPSDWEDESELARAKLARFLNDPPGDGPIFDCVIFDEAHHLRNAETLSHQFARLVVEVAEYKLLLSATPINLKSDDLRNLLRLLDPETFSNSYTFDILASENRPLVQARDKVLQPNVPFEDVLEDLRSLPRGEILKIGRQLESLQTEIEKGTLADTPTTRSRIAAQLEEMSLLGSVVNRTRRRDVSEIHVKRDPVQLRWEMAPLERHFYDAASNVVRRHAFTRDINERFLLATPQRLLASSLAAACQYWRARRPDVVVDDPDDDDTQIAPLAAMLADLSSEEGLLELLVRNDQKYALLKKAIEQQAEAGDKKLIVFSSFRITLDYLASRLSADGITIELMHGGIKEDRLKIVGRFADHTGPCVLLTSEVGAEGLDMQFCRALINYDLPWNPMKVEQRIGRIDRIGQKAKRITVMSMFAGETIEEQIYLRLYARLMEIEQTLGAFEAILGEEINSLAQRLLDPELTDEQRAAEIQRSALALENRHRETLALEEQAPGLIAHGDMILAQIAENHRPERRVGAAELADYVHEAISKKFPGSRISELPDKPGIFEVHLTAAAHLALMGKMKRGARFRTRLTRHATIAAAFERVTGLPKSIELVSTVHPLVQFAADIRKEAAAGVDVEPVVFVHVGKAAVNKPAGRYFAVAASWSVSGSVEVNRIAYAAMKKGGKPLEMAHAEALLQVALREGKTADGQVSEDEVAALRWLRDTYLDEAFNQFVFEEQARHLDRADTGIARLERQYEKNILNTREKIDSWKMSGNPKKLKMIPATQTKLNNLLARIEEKKVALLGARGAFNFQSKHLGMVVIEVR